MALLCSIPVEAAGTLLDRKRSEGSLAISPKVAIISLIKWMERQGYTKKNNNKIIGGPWKTADDIAKNLGLDNGEDLYSYETLVKAIKKNLSPEDQRAIFVAFTDNNTISGMGIPPDIQEYSKDSGEL